VERPTAGATPRRRRGKAAWTLILLAPICGELTFSAVGMPIMWLVFPVLVPMYGAGVLLVRELVVRVGGGWPSLILMGLVYELAEDGFGLQALTSPTMYNADAWGPRVLGFNTTYWESQAGYHIVFSVLIPIMITNLIFPELQREGYLRRRGLIGVSITAVVGIVLARVTFSSTEDPGYQAPLPFLTGLVIVMIILSFVALRVLPRRIPLAPSRMNGFGTDTAPSTTVIGLVAGAASMIFLGLLLPRGNPPEGPAIGDGAFVWLPMAAAAALAIVILLLVRRWSGAPGWADQHRIWLGGGALIGHTAFMIIMVLIKPGSVLTMVVALTTGPLVIIVTAVLLARLSKHVASRQSARHGHVTPSKLGVSAHEPS
jgi:hypothetical protein